MTGSSRRGPDAPLRGERGSRKAATEGPAGTAGRPTLGAGRPGRLADPSVGGVAIACLQQAEGAPSDEVEGVGDDGVEAVLRRGQLDDGALRG
jgi:hypothetical protein